MRMLTKWLSGGAMLVALAGLTGCDLLDVENPNNLVQEDIEDPAAANAIANGALATTTRALGYLTALSGTSSDEVTWIGSRDGWGQLNEGKFGDPRNEFTDAAFPFMGEARWMADEAKALIDGFTAEDPSNADLMDEQARANLYSAMIYTFLAESYDNFVFSNRQEPGMPLGETGMVTLFDDAVSRLGDAMSLTSDPDVELQALAVRVRAQYARAVWNQLKPSASTGVLVNDPGATADAMELLNRVNDDWRFQLDFVQNPTVDDRNNFANWLNNRSELAFGDRYITTDPAEPSENLGTKLEDPIDNIADPALDQIITEFEAGTDWSSLTVMSAREALLVLAEASLADGDQATATTYINRVRALYPDLSPFSGQIPAEDMLVHMRQTNLYLQNRRLADMYRFGIESDNWLPGTEAMTNPGTFFPIAQTEIDANPNVN